MVAIEQTRRQKVLASAYDEWVARPFASPNGPDIIVLSKDELAHGLFDCDEVLKKPEGEVYEITAATLNVRAAPGTASSIVGTLTTGAQVRAVVHNESWLRIVEGAYADRFIASAWAVPLP